MAALNDTDIKLDESWQLTQAANGDVPTAYGFDCIMQDISLEAVSQEGELFYDSDWGWSLIDFIQSEDDDLVELEIRDRIKTKLSNRDIINQESINVEVKFSEDNIIVTVSFQFVDNDNTYTVSVNLDRISVEVV